jgi:WXG100 family type VII secretion target
MKTDSAALSKEAANFDHISTQLQQAIRNVEDAGASLKVQMVGQAGGVLQTKLDDFKVAGDAQIQALQTISQTIQDAGVKYDQADQEHASNLASQMQI